MRTGVIFDIKQFAIFDGPGIRQTVFLKGCPLKCSWCHNPEGKSMHPQMMVSVASCVHCGKCLEVCPSKEHCILCGRCIDVCPYHLRHISGESVTVDELVKRIEKDSAYYRRYGGGVTFSGGEPLFQAEFLLDVLHALTNDHKAIETSGYADSAVFKEIYDALDYVIMDLKMMDPNLHRKYVGVDNLQILENAQLVCRGDKKFIIRIPCIPGINDTEDNYRETARFLQGAKQLEKVELLPYQKTAGAKYRMVGEKYLPKFDEQREVFLDTSVFQTYGIRSEIL